MNKRKITEIAIGVLVVVLAIFVGEGIVRFVKSNYEQPKIETVQMPTAEPKEVEIPISEANKLDINKAQKHEFEKLPGIGAIYASRILEHRETNGDFLKIEDIMNVKGIGQSRFDEIKELICVE